MTAHVRRVCQVRKDLESQTPPLNELRLPR